MNIKNLEKLVERLEDENNPVRFYMGDWFTHQGKDVVHISDIMEIIDYHSCGTAACLAGHAAILAAEDEDTVISCENYLDTSLEEIAKSWLDLDSEEAPNLFMGRWSPHDLSDITKPEAIKQLRHLIKKAS